MKTSRKKLLQEIANLSELYPDWRIGQLVSNVCLWAKGDKRGAIWDIEDGEFVQACQEHISKRKRRELEKADPDGMSPKSPKSPETNNKTKK